MTAFAPSDDELMIDQDLIPDPDPLKAAGMPAPFDLLPDPPPSFGPPSPTPPDPRDADIEKIIATLPPQSPGAVAPAEDPGAWAPPVPSQAHGMVPVAPVPGAPAGAVPPAPPVAEDVIWRRGVLAEETAADKAEIADRAHAESVLHQDDINDAVNHGNGLIAGRQKIHDDALAKYNGMELRDYWDAPDHSKFTAAIAIALGGLGAALSSAGGGSAENQALKIINKKVDDDFAHQKMQIEKARDSVVMARTGIQDAREAKQAMLEDLSARRVATLDGLETEARAQLAQRGVPAAQIDTDQRILDLQAARAKAALEAQKQRREDALAVSKERYLNARAARAERSGPIGGKGGAGQTDGMAKLSDYAIQHPGDTAGLYRLAGELKIPKPDKAVTAVVNQTKTTESQDKSATQATAGLRALDSIAASKYTPSRDDVQHWLTNQKKLYLVNQGGVAGGLATVGQIAGLLPQSEVDGLSPKAAEYFGNVRRFMEPMGRAKSGAAISQSEWDNFFNQYGPKSAGGLKAARADLTDLFKLSGSAGRKLEAGRPAKTGPVETARAELEKGAPKVDPAAKRAAAQRVVADPKTPADVKARAQQYLDANTTVL